MVLTLLKNIPSDASQMTVSMVAATPKPRLVKLAIISQGEEPFSIGDSSRKATHYVVKVEIGGAAGLVAPLLGSNHQTPTFGFSVGRLQSSSNRKARFFSAAPFGGLSWRVPSGGACLSRVRKIDR